MTAHHAYTVRYRRHGWKQRQARYFRDRKAAVRYVHKLRAGGWPDLAPLAELWIERQELGPVDVVWTLSKGRT